MANKLPENATLRDLTVTEEHVEYIGKVFENFESLGNYVVRIGTTGTGQSPNYRVEVYFRGSDHKPHAKERMNDENWSSKTMNLEEVRSYLAEIKEKISK